jgi:hypothetical protein
MEISNAFREPRDQTLTQSQKERFESLRFTFLSLVLFSVALSMYFYNSASLPVHSISLAAILLFSSAILWINIYYKQYKKVVNFLFFISLSLLTALTFWIVLF